MAQEFYTDDELKLLRKQLRNANLEAQKHMIDVELHPRIAEALAKK